MCLTGIVRHIVKWCIESTDLREYYDRVVISENTMYDTLQLERVVEVGSIALFSCVVGNKTKKIPTAPGVATKKCAKLHPLVEQHVDYLRWPPNHLFLRHDCDTRSDSVHRATSTATSRSPREGAKQMCVCRVNTFSSTEFFAPAQPTRRSYSHLSHYENLLAIGWGRIALDRSEKRSN